MQRMTVFVCFTLFVLVASPLAAAQEPAIATSPKIPLCEGLTIVTAVNDERGDYESIKQVVGMGVKDITFSYTVDLPDTEDDSPLAAILGPSEPKQVQPGGKERHESTRRVRREDLEKAHEYRLIFRTGTAEEFYPGSTAVGVSASVLRELKTQGKTNLTVPTLGMIGALGSLLGSVMGDSPEGEDFKNAGMSSWELKVVERGTIPFKVLVNDEPVQLPVIHAKGEMDDEDAEFWILDDPSNPIALRYSVGEMELQVIKLSFPMKRAVADSGGGPGASAAGSGAGSGPGAGSAEAERIEEDLAKKGRTIVYGIYFDFGSDRIKKQSDKVLAEIASVLQQNPTWKLTVEGHTDNIGGDAYNLDLSKRRAAAVKEALVTRHKIDATRLQTSGYGAAVPKDTNATMEGRARNRRVELTKVG